MKPKPTRLAAAAALAAAFSLAATPVQAAQLPRLAAASTLHDSQGYGLDASGYYGRRHHRHRDRIDAGDVLAGVLVLGAIAAVASSAGKSSRSERYDDRYREPPPPRPSGSYSSSGIDNAVDICTGQVERGSERIAGVDEASRRSDGWHISGQLEQGGIFECWIDNEGRIRSVDLGDAYPSAYQGADNAALPQDSQYSDDYYARARADQDLAADPAARL